MIALKQLSVVLTSCLLAAYCFTEAGIRSNKILRKSTVIHCPVAVCIHIVRYRERYLKRRIACNPGHPAGSYNPSIITNHEAHMIYGNMEGTGSSTKPKERCKTANKKAKTISDYFSAAANISRNKTTKINYDPTLSCVSESVAQIARASPCTSDPHHVVSSPVVSPELCSAPTVVTSTSPNVIDPQANTRYSGQKAYTTSYTNPHQPRNIKFPKRKFTGQNRSFQAAWFDLFSWLHYDEQRDSVLCLYCTQQNVEGNLKCASKKDQKFILGGFGNWEKALDKFRQHEFSECHKMAIDYAINFPKSGRNIIEMTNEESKKVRQINRRYLLKTSNMT